MFENLQCFVPKGNHCRVPINKTLKQDMFSSRMKARQTAKYQTFKFRIEHLDKKKNRKTKQEINQPKQERSQTKLKGLIKSRLTTGFLFGWDMNRKKIVSR